MNPSQLEALVLQAVERLRAGENMEDDRVEFKRSWPGADKARQLAGAANRAAGDDLVYIIGVDERDGSIHPTRGIDPAKWWAQMEASFDQTAPELVRHLNVHVSETESVVALLFRTDRPPYVVTVQNGGQTEREVPIRAGTRTRSAHRHELLRMLYPSISVPALTSVTGSLRLGPPDSYSSKVDEVVQVHMYVGLYFEHVDVSPAFLPMHSAEARLRGPRVSESRRPYHNASTTDTRVFGVLLRPDGIEVRGSGTAYLSANWDFPARRLKALAAVNEWKVDLEFEVAGVDKRAGLQMVFADRFMRDPHPDLADEFGWKLRNASY